MNLFVIPSWYPSEDDPIAGVFFREQAEAVAALCPDTEVVVSTWGHNRDNLVAAHPLRCLKTLWWWLREPGSQWSERRGVWEVLTPAPQRPKSCLLGGAWTLMAANRRNLRAAMARLGSVDLIHAHVSYPAGWIAARLSKEFGIPYVLTEHMSPFPFGCYLAKGEPCREIREAFREAAASVAVSASLAQSIDSFGLGQPQVIPNLVDERSFHPGPPTEEKFTFLTLGMLSRQKGIDILLRAIALWNPLQDDVQFWIGGDGALRESWVRLGESLGLSGKVRWLGGVPRDQAPLLYRRSHAFVLPSRHESFGVVYAEALAAGKPVIATRCGGPESIVTEQCGLLVPPEDPAALAQALEQMYRSWHSYDAAAIRAGFDARFSRPVVVARLQSLYRAVLAGEIKKK